jgi:hypothetical protein
MDMIIEGIESYEVRLLKGDDFLVKYTFTDVEGNDYLAQFKNDSMGPGGSMLGSSYELTYFVWDDEINDWSISKVVNSNIFRLVKTIFSDIVPEFLIKRPWVKMLRFEGLSKENEDKFAITQRTRLYIRFLTNNPINGYRMEKNGNKISLIKIIK